MSVEEIKRDDNNCDLMFKSFFIFLQLNLCSFEYGLQRTFTYSLSRCCSDRNLIPILELSTRLGFFKRMFWLFP